MNASDPPKYIGCGTVRHAGACQRSPRTSDSQSKHHCAETGRTRSRIKNGAPPSGGAFFTGGSD